MVSVGLIEILRDGLNVDVIGASFDSRLIDGLGVDSVGFAVGMIVIEDCFGVLLSEKDLVDCDTVSDLAAAIAAKSAAALTSS